MVPSMVTWVACVDKEAADCQEHGIRHTRTMYKSEIRNKVGHANKVNAPNLGWTQLPTS